MKYVAGKIYELVNRYERILFVLLVCIAVFFVVASFLLTNQFNIINAVAWILNELGLGIVTSVIVVLSYERFLHIKTSFYSYTDKLNMTLSERFPRSLSEKLSDALDLAKLSEKSRIVRITLDDLHPGSYFPANIVATWEILNLTEHPQIVPFVFNSCNLYTKQNSERKLRDGVYQVEDFSIVIGRDLLIDTSKQLPGDKIAYIQSQNDTHDLDYRFSYRFTKRVSIPSQGSARFEIASLRFLPTAHGTLTFFPSFVASGLEVTIASKRKDFLERLSYSFNVTNAERCCVSSIKKHGTRFQRSYSTDTGLFPYQGIILRWD